LEDSVSHSLEDSDTGLEDHGTDGSFYRLKSFKMKNNCQN
jgi:hypothetical protein